MFLHQKHTTKPIAGDEVNKTITVDHAEHRHFYKNKRWLMIFTSAGVVVLVVGSFIVYRDFIRQPAVFNPFTAAVLASAQTPLYYPTELPSGFHMVERSVTEPQAGVVVLDIAGPDNQKIYISEETRPSTFNMGNLYNKLTGLKETAVSGGSIAIGRLNNSQTEIGSRIYNKTWVLTNTNAPVSISSLTTMLKSLTISY
jgi:hypothetical protein